MNSIKNQFSIGIDGNYQASENARTTLFCSSNFRNSTGPSILRGR